MRICKPLQREQFRGSHPHEDYSKFAQALMLACRWASDSPGQRQQHTGSHGITAGRAPGDMHRAWPHAAQSGQTDTAEQQTYEGS